MTSLLDDAFAGVAANLRASTVRLHDARGRGSGSAIVWSNDGLLLTNAHVARGPYAVVETADGRQLRGKLLGRDADRDLAALRVDPDELGLPAVALRTGELRPGELVLAVGNPLGLVGAVTAGLVQRCNARWVIADVRLAPGNSGGPLADASGRVVGINSVVAGPLALAVPISAVVDFLGDGRARA